MIQTSNVASERTNHRSNERVEGRRNERKIRACGRAPQKAKPQVPTRSFGREPETPAPSAPAVGSRPRHLDYRGGEPSNTVRIPERNFIIITPAGYIPRAIPRAIIIACEDVITLRYDVARPPLRYAGTPRQKRGTEGCGGGILCEREARGGEGYREGGRCLERRKEREGEWEGRTWRSRDGRKGGGTQDMLRLAWKNNQTDDFWPCLHQQSGNLRLSQNIPSRPIGNVQIIVKKERD